MTDPSHSPHTDDTDLDFDPAELASTPRWVKVFGLIGLVLVVLVVVLLLNGGGPGRHGPGRHMGGGDPPPAAVTCAPAAPGGDLGAHARLARISYDGSGRA